MTGAERAADAAEDLRLVEVGVRCSLEQMLEEVRRGRGRGGGRGAVGAARGLGRVGSGAPEGRAVF